MPSGMPLSTEKREELFQTYYLEQNIRKLARTCHVSPTTAEKYKKIDEWDRRLNDIRQAAKQRADAARIDETARNIRFCRNLKAILLKPALEKQKIKTQNTIREFCELLDMELRLMGMPDTRPQTNELRQMSDEELISLLNALEKQP